MWGSRKRRISQTVGWTPSSKDGRLSEPTAHCCYNSLHWSDTVCVSSPEQNSSSATLLDHHPDNWAIYYVLFVPGSHSWRQVRSEHSSHVHRRQSKGISSHSFPGGLRMSVPQYQHGRFCTFEYSVNRYYSFNVRSVRWRADFWCTCWWWWWWWCWRWSYYQARDKCAHTKNTLFRKE